MMSKLAGAMFTSCLTENCISLLTLGSPPVRSVSPLIDPNGESLIGATTPGSLGQPVFALTT